MATKHSSLPKDLTTASSSSGEEEEEKSASEEEGEEEGEKSGSEEEGEEEEEEKSASEEGEEEEEKSESEEEEGGGAEENESDSDVDKLPKKPTTVKSNPLFQTSSSSSQDNEEEEKNKNESDSDDLVKSLKKPKPRTVPETSNPKKVVAKPTASTENSTPTTKKPSAGKRQLESDKSEKDPKKQKRKGNDDGEDDNSHGTEVGGEKKSNLDEGKRIPRVWSEEDEIILLKGMNEWVKKGIEPNSDLDGFREYIHKSLHVCDVTRDQVYNKIRRLKGKYFNNYKRRGESGEDSAFSKPHELKSYMIMREIWGEKEGKKNKKNNNDNDDSGTNIDVKESNRNVKPGTSPIALFEKFTMLGLSQSLSKEGLTLIGDSKAKDLEKKWKKLHAEELELNLKRLDLVREQTMLILNAIKSSDS